MVGGRGRPELGRWAWRLSLFPGGALTVSWTTAVGAEMEGNGCTRETSEGGAGAAEGDFRWLGSWAAGTVVDLAQSQVCRGGAGLSLRTGSLIPGTSH